MKIRFWLAICLALPILVLAQSSQQGTHPTVPPNITLTSINATSATGPYQYNGNTILQFPLDTNSEYQTILGINAAVGLSTSAIISTCLGTHTCGSRGVGMSAVENTAVGWNVLSQDTTGGFNTAVGVNTMGAETTGSGNVAVGEDSMRDTVGVMNTVAVGSNADRNFICTACVAVGYQTMSGGVGTTISANTLTNDTAIGYLALQGAAATTTGGSNTAVGANSMLSTALTTGHDNVGVGVNTLSSASMTTASFEVAVGSGALLADVSGTNNVAIGALSLNSLTTTSGNVSIGANAMKSNTGGNNSVAIGLTAMENSTGDTTSIAIGDQAMIGQSTSAGNEDIAIGFNTLGSTSRTTAVDDIAIGDRDLQTCTSCSNITAVGYHAAQVQINGTNHVIIGNGVASTTLTGGNNDIFIGTTNAVDGYSSGVSNELNIQNAIRGGTASRTSANLACGTTPAISGTATDLAGTITTGTGVFSSCVLTLAQATGTAPSCLVTAESGTPAAYATADNGTTATLTITTAVTSIKYDYWCPVH